VPKRSFNLSVLRTNCLYDATELNAKITDFVTTKGRCMTKEEWLEEYPRLQRLSETARI
jgi:hypothetical protein